MKWMSLVGFNI